MDVDLLNSMYLDVEFIIMALSTETNFLKIPENKFLWDRIRHFRFDEPGAVLTFLGKLAQKNNWTEPFTKQVIEEYRKFIFLCCIASGGASPSKIVDEAWHLHLTYTRSYWTDLCKNTLGMDLHHNPSNGGPDDQHKYGRLYKETLRQYIQVFGEVPPEDIWPRPKDDYKEINIPDFSLSQQRKLWIVSLLSIPFVFILLKYRVVVPFFLTGPQFLGFYALLAGVSVISYILIRVQRSSVARTFFREYFPEDVTPFHIARFLHGNHRAIQTGIVHLVHNGLLKVDKEKKFRVSSNRDYLMQAQAASNPFISLLESEEVGKELSYEEIASKWYREEEFSHPDLEMIREITSRKENFIRRYYLPLAVLLLGLVRVVQGVVNNRPVDFLVFVMFWYCIAIIIVTVIWSGRSIASGMAESIYKKKLYRKELGPGEQDKIVTNFALNGNSAIIRASEGVLLIGIFTIYTPQNPGSGWGGGGSSGGDGGDSGGGSCGGCGGCGGD